MRPVALSGFARVGKDTLFKLLQARIKNPVLTKLSLANKLKFQLEPLLKAAGLDPFTEESEEKALIRPLLVEYARILRIKSEGKFFTNSLESKLNWCLERQILPVITDLRFNEYPEDELFWLKKKHNGVLIFVEREGGKPANETEKAQTPSLRKAADFIFKWDDFGTEDPNIVYDRALNELVEFLVENAINT